MLLELNFTLVLFAASFLVFIYLLNLTLYKPVGNIIEKRKNLMESDYSKAKSLVNEANELLENYKIQIKKTRHETHNVIHEMTLSAQKVKEEEIQKLFMKLTKEKENSLLLLEKEKKAALAGLESDIKVLTDMIVNKVLGVEDKDKTLVGLR